jgi:hypothetical protein
LPRTKRCKSISDEEKKVFLTLTSRLVKNTEDEDQRQEYLAQIRFVLCLLGLNPKILDFHPHLIFVGKANIGLGWKCHVVTNVLALNVAVMIVAVKKLTITV